MSDLPADFDWFTDANSEHVAQAESHNLNFDRPLFTDLGDHRRFRLAMVKIEESKRLMTGELDGNVFIPGCTRQLLLHDVGDQVSIRSDG